jgi:polyhydroxybutyrate depolymerase
MRRLATLILGLAALASTACSSPNPKFTLESGGRERIYYVHTPTGYTPAKSWPLVFIIHGRFGTGPGMQRIAHFDDFADREGILAVYPDGIRRSWADGRGDSPAESEGVDDVAFFAALLDKLEATYSIDPARVYASGVSNGGFMSFRLACDPALSARIAAIAPVAASFSMRQSQRCQPSRPVPVIQVNGTDDPLVPYKGGEVSHRRGDVVPSATGSAKDWARLDGCAADPARDSLPPRTTDGLETRREIYSGCRDHSEVALYSIIGGGHTWPGGKQYLPQFIVGKTSRDIDANEIIWQFFQAHPLPSGKL